MPFVSGQASEAFGKYDAFALVPLVLAIFVYYSQPEMDDIKRKELEEREASTKKRGFGRGRSGSGGYNITIVSPRVASGPFRNRYRSLEYGAMVRTPGVRASQVLLSTRAHGTVVAWRALLRCAAERCRRRRAG